MMDPIFEAIERHRQLDAAHAAVCEAESEMDQETFDDASGAACIAAFDALEDLVAMTPTTLAGCIAMLRYCHEVTHSTGQRGGRLFYNYGRVEDPADDLLLRLADRIEKA